MFVKNHKSIVLINPPLLIQARYGKDLKKFGAVSEPLGLAYLAANLEKNGWSVSIIDAPALNLDDEKIISHLNYLKPNLVGMTVLTPMHDIVKNLAAKIKNWQPNIKIVVGGAHATALKEKILATMPAVDFVCVGEGEETLVELAEAIEHDQSLNKINGLIHRQNETIICNSQRELINDLDLLPPPARHLLPMDRYKLTASRTKGTGYCPTIIVARGCPFNCSYCSHPMGRTFRHHSVDRIITEIKKLIADYQIEQINLEADTLTVDKNFLLSLCRALTETGISQKVKWTCESRIDTIDEEKLCAMKQAGCWQISYGVESGVQRLLDLIDKKEKLEDIERVFNLTKKFGIAIRAFFMLGLPTETSEESWQTINFAKKLNPLWAQFTLTVPYPGTPMFEQLRGQGEIKNFDWSCYNTWAGWTDREPPYIPAGRTLAELKKLQKKALVSFYLRPITFFKLFRQINSFQALKNYGRGFWIIIKNKFQ